MKLNEYQQLAARTANQAMPLERRREIAALGIVGEAGELCDLIKKIEGHGHPEDHAALAKEAGDICWYAAEVATTCGLDLEAVAGVTSFDDLMADAQDWTPSTRVYAALMLGSAAGRVATVVAREPNVEQAMGESLSAFLHRFAILAHLYGLDLAAVAEANIAKLKKRYPTGFSSAASLARVDVKEA